MPYAFFFVDDYNRIWIILFFLYQFYTSDNVSNQRESHRRRIKSTDLNNLKLIGVAENNTFVGFEHTENHTLSL